MASDARDSSSGVELFRCPTCAATLEVVDAPSVKCKYCGNSVPVPPDLRPHKPQVVIQQVDFNSPQVVEATKAGRNIGCLIGCISCFSCKRISRKKDGVCAVQDDLTSVLDRVKNTDAMIIGTALYYGAESASTRALLERLCFPYNKYAKDIRTLFPKSIRTALIYTMNVSEEMLEVMGSNRHFGNTKMILEMVFGACELLLSTDTLQYNDYDKYDSERFDKEVKAKRHAEVFPDDCKRAFELGVRVVSKL